jgi:hypothetical protein
MDIMATLVTGLALLGCMILSYIRGWKDAVMQYSELEEDNRENQE